MPEATAKTFKAKRAQIKATLTRANTYLDALDEEINNIDIQERLTRLEPCLEQFNSIQSELELVEETESNENERSEFENNYFRLITHMKKLLLSNSVSNSPSMNGSRSHLFTTNMVRLPQINLPTFSGSYEEWFPFHDTFVSLIHNSTDLNDIQKFHYLKSSLKDEAAQVIHSLELSSDNYVEAWELLKERYCNKHLFIKRHIGAIFDLPLAQKESADTLRTITDGVLKHLRALKALKRPVDSWDDLLIYLITSKLDPATVKEWEGRIIKGVNPEFKGLTEFLTHKCQILEAFRRSKPQPTNVKPFKKPTLAHVSTQDTACTICAGKHSFYNCGRFLQMTPNVRIQEAKTKALCLNCLRPNHYASKCTAGSCRKCKKNHNTLLHLPRIEEPEDLSSPKPMEPQATTSFLSNSAKGTQVFLSTALVNIMNSRGQWQECRAILDSGSQSNFMTKAMAQKLALKQSSTNIPIVGINTTISHSSKSVCAKIKSRHNAFKTDINCLILDRISANLPQSSIDPSAVSIPKNIRLADPNFHKSGTVDLLIGTEVFWQSLCIGQIKSSPRQPYIQKTHFGWVVAGNLSANKPNWPNTMCNLAMSQKPEIDLTRFWKLEECHQAAAMTKEEQECERHFMETHTRGHQGRFIVRLPKRSDPTMLGDSRHVAERRFMSLERKLSRQPALKAEYAKFMSEYLDLGHMKVLRGAELLAEGDSFYLPHHPVVKDTSTTTRLRVVFDGSAKTSNGCSLNDLLMVGPKLQDDLFFIATRFRTYQFVVTADIEKMYRQVAIHTSDTKWQRILWRFYSSRAIDTYELQTVTYGTASASYLAVKALQHLAITEGIQYPVGAAVASADFYVDDLLTGANTIRELEGKISQTTDLLSRGGFNRRKWHSNCPQLLNGLADQAKDPVTINMGQHESIKTLGLQWNSCTDMLEYKTTAKLNQTKITKRSILSTVAHIFDPLGLIGPVILKAKMLIQELWIRGLDWDESVPQDLYAEWTMFETQRQVLNEVRVPRQATIHGSDIALELCGFADASERAYGACVYLRSTNSEGIISCHLMCAGWNYSRIVLAWIKSTSRTWKTFVANRVSEVQELTEPGRWNHIPTTQNPADLVSRGEWPQGLLDHPLWWNGPAWLSSDKALWPATETALPSIADVPEARKTDKCVVLMNQADNSIFTRFSEFSKLVRVVAYCLRFTDNTRVRQPHRTFGQLSVRELTRAEDRLAQIVQRHSFPRELAQLITGQQIHPRSKLLSLNPFLDDQGTLRAGGRLRKAALPYERTHPVLLPSDHPFTHMVIRREHQRQLHAGAQATLASIRRKYWPLSGRRAVRGEIRKCVSCFRAKPTSTQPMMGDLPSARVRPSRPFNSTGIDYCGPFLVHQGSKRSKQTCKAYVSIFVCLATKAIHIELVSNLTTEAFIAALKRFMARRGKPAELYSDNGTNFVGANKELELLRDLYKAENQRKINQAMSEEGVQWHFIPPGAPHFGGIWEAAVKAVKHHLRRTMGETRLTLEELYTLLTQIEAILNSRPLTPLSSDPNDTSVLTPGHFLIGDSVTATAEPDLTKLKINHLSRWQLLEQIRQHFWKRWSKEYLTQLQERSRWKQNQGEPLREGQLVVVREDNLPPLRWITGRVEAVHPGEDGVVRVATLRTPSGHLKRPTRKLCILPNQAKADE